MKECCMCKIVKETTLFYKNKAKKDGLSPTCVDCAKLYAKQNRKSINENAKKRRENNINHYKKKEKERRVKNKNKISEVNRIYREENKESIKEYQDAYRKEHGDRIRASLRKGGSKYKPTDKDKKKVVSRRYYLNNREKLLFITKEKMRINRGLYNAYSAKRRALKIQATPSWYEKDKIELLYKKAKELSELLGIKMEVDHVIPLNHPKVCGLHTWYNLQLLESSLNREKSNLFVTRSYV